MNQLHSFPFLFFLFIAGSLAVFRAAEMWQLDSGPFNVFERIRRSTCHVPVLCEMLQCFYCCSTWGALLYTIWIWCFMDLPLWLAPVWWFSVTGGAALIYRTVRERE